ncbi:MAG: zinc ribbon domain-containing protein [bacterium]
MPIYEYQCEKCGEFEVTQRITEGPLKKCPTCKRKVKKLISSTSFQLKGSGWYVTDYARKGKDGGKDGGAEAKGGDSKTSGGESAASSGESKSASGDSASSSASPSTGGTSSGETSKKPAKKDSTAKAA